MRKQIIWGSVVAFVCLLPARASAQIQHSMTVYGGSVECYVEAWASDGRMIHMTSDLTTPSGEDGIDHDDAPGYVSRTLHVDVHDSGAFLCSASFWDDMGSGDGDSAGGSLNWYPFTVPYLGDAPDGDGNQRFTRIGDCRWWPVGPFTHNLSETGGHVLGTVTGRQLYLDFSDQHISVWTDYDVAWSFDHADACHGG